MAAPALLLPDDAAAERRLADHKAREKTAERLLRSSAKVSFDPRVDVDWDAPFADGLYFVTPEQASLYGTPMWDGMTEAARIDLTRHEMASIAATGVWFEIILMQMLIRRAYDQDPTRRHTQYAITEIGDECRHSVMFARMVERLGCPAYRRSPVLHELGRLFKTLSDGPVTFAGALVAEEVTDAMQRSQMVDDRVQPFVQTISRIHVVEEARHVRFAREEAERQWGKLGRTRRAASQATLFVVAERLCGALIHPDVYPAVGLDAGAARQAVRASEHRRQTMQQLLGKTVDFLDSVGAIGTARPAWRRAGLLA